MVIGIVVAIPPEFKIVKQHFNINSSPGSTYKEVKGSLNKHTLIIYQTGIGKVSAAGATQHLIDSHSPDFIINLGIAASISSALEIFDTAISNKFVQWDFNSGFMDRPENWHPEYKNSLLMTKLPPGFPETELITATGDSFVSDKEVKETLSNRGFHLCDMEGGAIAQVCAKSGVPFVLLKGISDVGEGTGKNFKEIVKKSVENSIRELERILSI